MRNARSSVIGDGFHRRVRVRALALLTALTCWPGSLPVHANEAPTCTILASGRSIQVGEVAVLSAIAVDPEGLDLSYSWHFGGGADVAAVGEAPSGSLISIQVTFDVGNQAFPVALTVSDSAGRSTSCRSSLTVGLLPDSTRVPVSEQPAPGAPQGQNHTLLAFNDLGMHCADLGSIPFSILPPFNTVNAQVIERGHEPRLLGAAEATLRYSAASSSEDPVLPPDVLELSNQTIGETAKFEARSSVSAGSDFVVEFPGDVTFRAGASVLLDDGFSIAAGAVFEAGIDDRLLSGPPSINSTSQNWPVGSTADLADIRKTDFWDPVDPSNPSGPTVVSTLFGLNPPPDEGLATIHNVDGTGRRMPGIGDPYVDNDPQPFSTYQPEFEWFKAEGIPMTAVDDFGRANPYPLMRVEAVSLAGGAVLAAIDTVVPVSTEVDCRDCHALGQVGADPAARATDPGFVSATFPGDRVSEEWAAKTNVIALHDFLHGTDLGSEPAVLCARCHNSFALEEVTGGALAGNPFLPSMSSAMHGHHGQFVVDASSGELLRNVDGDPVLRIALQAGEERLIPVDPENPAIGMEQNCFSCHPGKITQCFRGAMFAAGLKCSSCHGDMLATGGVFDGDFDDSGTVRQRLPWRDEPRCESCHLGDAADPGPASMLAELAFDPTDPAAVPTLAGNKRFAENETRGWSVSSLPQQPGSWQALPVRVVTARRMRSGRIPIRARTTTCRRSSCRIIKGR